MKIKIHRGSSGFDGCCIEVHTAGTRILLDMGYPLVESGKPLQNRPTRKTAPEERSESDDLSSPDYKKNPTVLPRIDGLYRGRDPLFDAVILARVNLDQDSLLQHLNPDIPIWLSAGTKALIEEASRFRLIPRPESEFQLFPLDRPFTIKDVTVHPHRMDHAICDVSAFEIRAEGQTLLYAGDFSGTADTKSCLGAFSQRAARQADMLLIDGAMFERSSVHLRTEEEIEQELVALMSEPGPFFFQCASQNIDRIITFYNACRSTRRQFIIDPFTANVLHDLRKLGYSLPSPGVGSDAMHLFSPRAAKTKPADEAGHEQAHRFSRWQVSRPQVMSMSDRIAMLVRPAMLTDLRKMPSLRGGQMVFSMPQAFRETPGQKRLEHLMLARGTTIVPLHTGGHARIIELNKLIDILRPKSVRLVNDLQPDQISQLRHPAKVVQDGETLDF